MNITDCFGVCNSLSSLKRECVLDMREVERKFLCEKLRDVQHRNRLLIGDYGFNAYTMYGKFLIRFNRWDCEFRIFDCGLKSIVTLNGVEGCSLQSHPERSPDVFCRDEVEG